MNYIVTVSGTVHALDKIRDPQRYAKATFNDTDQLSVLSEGKQLTFRYVNAFTTSCIDELLTSLVTIDTNVEWDLKVKAVKD